MLNDFDAWARISARLRSRTEAQRRAILTEHDAVESWQQVDAHWRSVLINDIATGDMERAFRYSDACSTDLAGRSSEPPIVVSQAPSAAGAIAAPCSAESPPAARPPAIVEPKPAVPDFRHDALYRPADPSSTDAAPPDDRPLLEQMGSEDREVQPPVPGQDSTAPLDRSEVSDTLQAARAAAKWPVTRYAALCAAVEADPDSTVDIAERYGLPNRATFDFVCRQWQRRLASDAPLFEQFSRALAAAREP